MLVPVVSLLLVPFLASLPLPALSADAVACVLPTAQTGLKDAYDLTPLQGIHTVSAEDATPPTTTTHRVRLIVCGGPPEGLEPEPDYGPDDQCPPQTLACLQIQNTSPRADPQIRTLSVIPLAGDQIPAIDQPLTTSWATVPVACAPETFPPKGKKTCEGLRAIFGGGRWKDVDQHLNITFLCRPGETLAEPSFVGYDPAKGTLALEWAHEAACPTELRGPPGDEHGAPPSSGRGGRGFLGWLFILILFVPPIYLGLGIYHNRTTYDAHGWDLIPHKEFWQDFPSLVKDLASHLLGGVRASSGGGSGRGGYEAIDG